MNEWKELKIDNLPSDILVEGKYEIADYDSYQGIYVPTTLHPVDCLSNIITSKRDYTYFYRTPEPQPKTHEEIMTKWWKDGAGIWFKVLGCGYSQSENKRVFYVMPNENREWSNYFTNRESAVIPPEVNKE